MLMVKQRLLFMLIQQKVGLTFKMQKTLKQVQLNLYAQQVGQLQHQVIIKFIHSQVQELLQLQLQMFVHQQETMFLIWY